MRKECIRNAPGMHQECNLIIKMSMESEQAVRLPESQRVKTCLNHNVNHIRCDSQPQAPLHTTSQRSDCVSHENYEFRIN